VYFFSRLISISSRLSPACSRKTGVFTCNEAKDGLGEGKLAFEGPDRRTFRQ
jgi:hypothetical protein